MKETFASVIMELLELTNMACCTFRKSQDFARTPFSVQMVASPADDLKISELVEDPLHS